MRCQLYDLNVMHLVRGAHCDKLGNFVIDSDHSVELEFELLYYFVKMHMRQNVWGITIEMMLAYA